MRFERIRKFVGQMHRYLTSIAALLRGMFVFRPRKMIELMALSIAGTSLQAFSLGTTFLILRHLDNHLFFNIKKVIPFLHFKVHATLMLAGVMAVLGVAVYLLYRAERSAVELSSTFANSCGAAMLERFSTVANRISNLTVNPRTGAPISLSGELSNQSGKLELASRRLLKSPVGFFQVLYGMGFLLYLEPWLTMILAVVSIPLLIPLKRLTVAVRIAERLRIDSYKGKSSDVSGLVEASGRFPVIPGHTDSRIEEIFEGTGFAAANHHRCERLVALAGSRAVATAAMVITGLTAMIYFWMFYSGQKEQVALIVVYFGALRMAVMSGRKMVARISGFARFYEPVQEFLGDEIDVARHKETTGVLRGSGIMGPDMTQESRPEIRVDGNGPFSVAGVFPLLPVNRYAATYFLPSLNGRRRAASAARMTLVVEDPAPDPSLTWREFLRIDPERDLDWIKSELERCCRVLNPAIILERLDEHLPGEGTGDEMPQQERIEAVLLKAMFSGAPLVVVREEALSVLGQEAVAHWKEVLSDRLLLFYYRYERQQIGRWGERYAVLVGLNPSKEFGIAPIEWVSENPDPVMNFLTGRTDVGDKPWEEFEWDDDDDDDDDD